MRGKIGQNISNFKSYSGRVLIDCVRQSESPVATAQGLRWEVITKGDASFNGEYGLFAAEPFDVVLTGGSPATIQKLDPATYTVRMNASAGKTAQLHLLFTDGRAALPKGVQLIRPGYTAQQAADQVFTNEYVDLLRKLNAGVLRLMDALRTNGSECTDAWCDAAELLWGVKGRGAPLEPLVDLAQRLDADVWMNVPHKATDAYVRKAAETIKSRLLGDKRVYVEFSNECWNNAGGFPQTEYCRQQGDELAKTDNRFFALGRTQRGRFWYAKRLSEVAAIFFDVFAEQAWRVVPMLCGQTGDSSVLRDALAYGYVPKAVCIGGYYNTNTPEGAKALWEGQQVRKFCDTAAGLPAGTERLIYEWTNAGALPNDPANAASLAAWGQGFDACGLSAACHFVPLADPGSAYAATNEAASWTSKCQALSDLSAARPHPYAQKPDPKDLLIADLRHQVDALTAAVGQANEKSANLAEQLAQTVAAATQMSGDLSVAKAQLSAIKAAGGW